MDRTKKRVKIDKSQAVLYLYKSSFPDYSMSNLNNISEVYTMRLLKLISLGTL